MSDGRVFRFEPPGPISRGFLENLDPVSVLWGPVESGKTATSLMRGLFATYVQPAEADGVRRIKGAIIRSTYRDLWENTIPSWWEFFPKEAGDWVGGRGEPAHHMLQLKHPKDAGKIELTVSWMAFGENSLERALRGLQIHWAYVDECDLVDRRGLPWLLTRCGRYRKSQHLQPGQNGFSHAPVRLVWGSCNATDVDHWIYEDGLLAEKPRVKVYRLPSGLARNAERPPGVTEETYRVIERTMEPDEARRFVHGEPAYSRDGEPVLPEYSETMHVAAEDLELLPMRQLVIGLDAGGHPAATFWQERADGQARGLDEIPAPLGGGKGPRRFGEELGDLLHTRWPRLDGKQVIGIADPSAMYGADREDGELDWLEVVARTAKIRVVPAPTNNLTPRLEVWRRKLTTLIDGREPGLILSPRMRRTRRALAADYRYKRVPVGLGKWRAEDKPDKNSPNRAADLIDCGGYALLHLTGYAAALGREQHRRSFGQPIVAATGFVP